MCILPWAYLGTAPGQRLNWEPQPERIAEKNILIRYACMAYQTQMLIDHSGQNKADRNKEIKMKNLIRRVAA